MQEFGINVSFSLNVFFLFLKENLNNIFVQVSYSDLNFCEITYNIKATCWIHNTAVFTIWLEGKFSHFVEP